MHITAMENGKRFAERYLDPTRYQFILDVGSFDVNGSLREVFNQPLWQYVGMDKDGTPENNVDVLLNEDGTFPFPDDTFDALTSSSCLEHDATFWRTFQEMIRVIRPGGLIYIMVPSQGRYHAYPIDCYRFLKDFHSAMALTFPAVELLEQYITPNCEWEDNIGIYRKREE